MGATFETEVTRLKGLYPNGTVIPITDLLELVASLDRLTEENQVKFTELDAVDGTLAAGLITGSNFVQLTSINAAPGTQTTRTAALLIADHGVGVRTVSYMLRITNTGAGTLTLAAGSGITLTGTMTVAQNTFRDFIVTLNGAAGTGTIRSIATGTYS